MSKNFAVAFGIGIVCIAIAVAGIMYMQRGAHIDLPGKVLKVRTAPLDENSSVAVVDFRINNPSDYPFVVRTVTVTYEEATGAQADGQTISDVDAKRLFEAIPLLGQKFNDSLLTRDRVLPHTTLDRMIAARFEFPEARLESRKRLVVRIEEVDGKIVELPDR